MQCFQNQLSEQEIKILLHYHACEDDRSDRRPDVYSKHPRWNQDVWPQHIVQQSLDQLLDYQYQVEEVIFNDSLISFRLHADSGDGEIDRLGHAVLIPLMVEGAGSTVFFDNYWHGSSTRFTRVPNLPFEYHIPNGCGTIYHTKDLRTLLEQVRQGDTPPELDHMQDLEATLVYLVEARRGNKLSKPDNHLADYTEIKNFDPQNHISDDVIAQYLTHIPRENLYGLRLDQVIKWVPGDAIVFDRTQLHCAGSGHDRKIGITVFTRRA